MPPTFLIQSSTTGNQAVVELLEGDRLIRRSAGRNLQIALNSLQKRVKTEFRGERRAAALAACAGAQSTLNNSPTGHGKRPGYSTRSPLGPGQGPKGYR